MSNYGEWQESKKEYKKEKRKERQKSQLKMLKWFVIIIVPLLIIVGITKGKENSNESVKPMTESAQIKKEFDSFKKQVLSETTQMVESEANFNEFVKAYSSGSFSRVEAYENVKEYRDIINQHRSNLIAMKFDERFPEKLGTHLTEGKSKILDGVAMKDSALASLLEYLDEGKTSELAEYRENSPLYLVGVKAGLQEINVVEKIVNPKKQSTGKASK
ncbi:hypothetical protein A9P44_00270 [Paenibacillus polymyxa]|nr:hypothetical protein [Paenibacillus polymyxa]OBA07822.1 hypothetical protein A9P44_00270 [Paenibacillus polymyxa]